MQVQVPLIYSQKSYKEYSYIVIKSGLVKRGNSNEIRQVLIFNQLGSLRSICNVGVSQNRIIFLYFCILQFLFCFFKFFRQV